MKRFSTAIIYYFSIHSRGVSLITLVTGASTLSMLYLFSPAASSFFPPCPFRALTGWLCPGCGSLRGLHELLHGHFLPAWELNPLMILSLPLILWAGVSHLSILVRERPLPWLFIKPIWIWLLLTAILMFWVARNL